MTKLGEYRHKVWADEPVSTQDQTTGEPVVEFVQRSKMSCKIETIGGSEALRSDQVLADMDALITVPWSSFAASITEKWRLRFVRIGTNITFNISRKPAEKFMNMREIEFTCNAGLNDG